MSQNMAIDMNTILYLLMCAIFGFAAGPAESKISTPVAIMAVQHRICYNAFWYGMRNFVFGKSVTATLRTDDDITYAWIDNLRRSPNVSHVGTIFKIYAKADRTAVTDMTEYNLDIVAGYPPFEQIRNYVLHGQTERATITIPITCRPKFDPDTIDKQHMILAIEDKISYELSMFNKIESRYPNHVQIIISNFNIDYPSVFVLISGTGRIFHVDLYSAGRHDEVAPPADTYLKDEFLVLPIQNKNSLRALTQRIKKYGIVREIDLKN